MEFTAEISDMSIDIKTRKPKITFLADSNILTSLEELNGSKLNVEVKKYYSKRSLDANAYMWVLVRKLAERLEITAMDVYKKEIKDLGIYEVLPIKDEAVETFIRGWERKDSGWMCETFKSKLEGYTNVKAYYGSSSYDKNEMSRLLESIVQDCKELNIEVKSDEEINNLLNEWGKKQ